MIFFELQAGKAHCPIYRIFPKGLRRIKVMERAVIARRPAAAPGRSEPVGLSAGGHILITTRRDTGWNEADEVIRLDVLSLSAATELLTARTRQQDDASHGAAEAIATEHGCLPLALEQAAAYITQTRISLADYLNRLRAHPRARYEATGGRARQTISRVWDITIEAIGARARRTA